MAQDQQSLVDELHSEWLKPHHLKQSSEAIESKITLVLRQRYISFLEELLDMTIATGKLLANRGSRVELQWLARDIGDTIYSLTSVYAKAHILLDLKTDLPATS